jgi:CubicO group peptidase (beta-lactamase class C family)
VESLAGASSGDGPVRVATPVGRYLYSGGGFTVAQLAAESVTGRPFADIATELVLRPLGMDYSDYDCTTSEPADATPGHDANGAVSPRYRYTEAAAAGLCSTADDLARFVAALVADGKDARLMATPTDGTDGGYGLGLELGGSDDRVVIAHLGVNRGYYSYFVALPDQGFGVVVLTNGDGGRAVVDAVLAAISG